MLPKPQVNLAEVYMTQAPCSDPSVQEALSQDEFHRARYVPGARFLATTIGVLLSVYVVTVLFGPIVWGWDTYSSFARLHDATVALRAGDLFPVWTPANANGFGSPVTFFYHKLFSLVGAFFTIATGDAVTGFRLAVLLFSTVMFYGVQACAGRLGADTTSRLVIATASLYAPFALRNLIEGCDVAQYAAMSIIPLILAIVIDLQLGRFRKWQGAVLFVLLSLLILAHVLIFVGVIGLLLLFAFHQVAVSGKGRWPFVVGAGAALLAFVVLVYVPFVFWSVEFCPDQAKIFGAPDRNVMSFQSVFSPFPGSFTGWPLFALLAGMVIQICRPKSPRIVIAFGMVALVLTLLVTRIGIPFWRASHLLDFVQFPYRLLTIAMPICFVAVAGLIERLPFAAKRRVQLGLLVIALLHAVAATHLYLNTFPTVALATLRQELPLTGTAAEVRVSPDAGGEYFPAAFQSQLARIVVWKVSPNTVLPAPRSLVETAGCTYENTPRPTYFNELRVSVVCPTAGHLRVNQFSTPFLYSVATGSEGALVKPVANDQFIDFALPAGQWNVVVKERTYLDLVLMAWRARLSRYGI